VLGAVRPRHDRHEGVVRVVDVVGFGRQREDRIRQAPRCAQLEVQGEVADPDQIARGQHLLFHAAAVDVRAVRAPQIVYPPTPERVVQQLGVGARDRRVIEHDLGLGIAPDDEVAACQGNASPDGVTCTAHFDVALDVGALGGGVIDGMWFGHGVPRRAGHLGSAHKM
jgi:hypothetical protein